MKNNSRSRYSMPEILSDEVLEDITIKLTNQKNFTVELLSEKDKGHYIILETDTKVVIVLCKVFQQHIQIF